MNRLETVGRAGHDPDAGDLLSLGVLHGVSLGNQACRGQRAPPIFETSQRSCSAIESSGCC